MDPRLASAARFQQQKNYPAAEQIYRRILQVEPKNVDALLLLGLLLHETSRNEESVETLRRALKIQPHRAEVRQTLVGPLLALGKLAEAIIEARELARLRPMVAEMHDAVARLLMQANDAAGALPYAKRAAELQPRSPALLVTLGRAYGQLNQAADALAMIDRALTIDAKHGDALIEKAIVRQSQGQIDEAIALYEAGLKVAPKNVAALNNLGGCYLMKTRSGDALRCFEAAAQIWPTSPKPRSNVGAVLKELGHIDEAITHFHKALQLDPTYADAYCNLGAAYATVGEHKLAIEACRQALRVKPDFTEVGSNLLLSLLSPTDISPVEVFSEHVAWGRAHTTGLEMPAPKLHHSQALVASATDPVISRATETAPLRISGQPANQRIRIGYVSADFREHSVRYFIEPILAAHDRSQFEIICYASGRRRDEVTDRLAGLVDGWHFVAELTNQQLAELICTHQIDILVDLAGHTSDHRLLTFARKPAAVQVTYLGYPTTTGMTAIDYRLTDSICDPPGADAFYTEKLIRLPNTFFVYSDDEAASFDPVLPADRNGFFTFGSFNSFTKINDETLESWATIMRAVPSSRLLMKARPLENPSTRQRVIGFFAQRDVPADRLDLRAWVTMPEHTALLGSAIDLMLDTFPYNGHTTSCQAIWRGVPVVTRSGDNFRSRVGECILRNLDLADFIGSSGPAYERIAIHLATDLNRLRDLRPNLRRRMLDSPLGDVRSLTRSLEAAYIQMLQLASATASARTLVDWALELHQNGHLAEALESYHAGLRLDPTNAAALNNLGACYLTLGRVEDGIHWLKKAAELNPTEPRSRNNIGTALEDLGRVDEAIEQYRAAAALDPGYVEATINIGSALSLLGEHKKAIANFRLALKARPDFAVAHSNLLMSMIASAEFSEQAVLDEHLAWDRQHALPLRSEAPQKDFDAGRRLRIAYVSPDFKEHSVRYFIEPILRSHDRSEFEVFCYSVGAKQDEVTKRLSGHVEQWRNAAALNDDRLAQQIRQDRIDILIDLAGHTSEHRLLTFARSPAPVQATYLGYPATTGLQAIQYRLSDAIADPPGSESFCSEQLVRLPKAFFVFQSDQSLRFFADLPADRNGFATFGYTNNFGKISDAMLQNWAQILLATPKSRLVLIAKALSNHSTQVQLRRFFAQQGIADERIDLIGFLPIQEYYDRLGGMDLLLDPFPFNGHTTTCQSLWMGVPVITRSGNAFRSRMGRSVLTNLGLDDFVTESDQQYVQRAVDLATDLHRLREVKPTLRERMLGSPICDAKGFTRSLEQAYRQMWAQLTGR